MAFIANDIGFKIETEIEKHIQNFVDTAGEETWEDDVQEEFVLYDGSKLATYEKFQSLNLVKTSDRLFNESDVNGKTLTIYINGEKIVDGTASIDGKETGSFMSFIPEVPRTRSAPGNFIFVYTYVSDYDLDVGTYTDPNQLVNSINLHAGTDICTKETLKVTIH
jgi:hypothetical protein